VFWAERRKKQKQKNKSLPEKDESLKLPEVVIFNAKMETKNFG